MSRNRDTELLKKHGWVWMSSRRQGCMKIVMWHHPATGQTMRQGDILNQIRLHQHLKKGTDAEN